MTELALKNLVKKFDDVTAVDDFSLTIPTGGFVALLGYSGCGKTTALRLAAGLEAPEKGEIFLNDKPPLCFINPGLLLNCSNFSDMSYFK